MEGAGEAVNGTWQTTGGGGGGKVIGLVAAAVAVIVAAESLAALLATLAEILLITAAVVIVVVLGLVVAALLLRRRFNPDYSPALAEQAAAVRALAAEQTATKVVHYHGGTHLHIEPGTDPALIRNVIAGETAREKEIY